MHVNSSEARLYHPELLEAASIQHTPGYHICIHVHVIAGRIFENEYVVFSTFYAFDNGHDTPAATVFCAFDQNVIKPVAYDRLRRTSKISDNRYEPVVVNIFFFEDNTVFVEM